MARKHSYSTDEYNRRMAKLANVKPEVHETERTIGQVTERVTYHTRQSEDGTLIMVGQREYTPMMGFLAWPISSQKMDAEARKINPRARVFHDWTAMSGARAVWHRVYEVRED